MLISFSIENFLSFDKKTEFSFRSGHVIKKPEHVYSFNKDKLKLLKFSIIYGKNGSGKTNLLKALLFIKKIITTKNALQKTRSSYCRCNPHNSTAPSSFEISFIINNSIYKYSLKVSLYNFTILEEQLFKINNEKELTIFKYEKKSGYEFSNDINSEDIQILSRNFDSSQQSFIYYINTNASSIFTRNKNSIILKQVFNWFDNTLEIIFPDKPVRETALSSVDKHFYLEEFTKLLNDFDTGITEILTEPASKDNIYKTITAFQQKQIDDYTRKAISDFKLKQQNQKNHSSSMFSIVFRSRNDICIMNLDNEGEPVYNHLLFVHEYNGITLKLTMAEESDGFYRLFQLIEILLNRNEKVYIIDEINRSLHPKLTAHFISKYLEYANDKKLQLLATSHETNLMNLELLRQDEIWIADLKADNSTSLFSLGDLKVRTDKVIDKNYLSNSWGGVPVFKDDFDLMEFLTGNAKG